MPSTSTMHGVLSSSQLYSMFSSPGSGNSEIPPYLQVAMPSTSTTPAIGTGQFRGIQWKQTSDVHRGIL